MKVLVIGSGGREHALVWKIKQSPLVDKIFCIPGNAGITKLAECADIKLNDFPGLANFALKHKVGLTAVGPEIPLSQGITDYFQGQGLKIFGPNKNAAQLEASKAFSKNFMKKHGVATAKYEVFTDCASALKYLASWQKDTPVVVKASGLAAGKGVIICTGPQEAKDSVKDIMENKVFGKAGDEIVIEEHLDGEEASIMVFIDSDSYSVMVSSQDHKRAYDNDQGPNTGGMGAYAPAPIVDDQMKQKVTDHIIKPILAGLKKENITYQGVLYIGLMICSGEPYVLEFNCRFGDPETQVVLPLLNSDLVEIMQAIIENRLDKLKIEWYNKSAVCVVLASGGYPGSYAKHKQIKGLSQPDSNKDIIVFHAGTAVVDSKIVTSGGRVLGVTGLGDSISDAIDSTYSAVRGIDFEDMHFRKDIGHRALANV